MPFKFEAPIKLPRFTQADYDKQKAAYVAKHGYSIHVPGFQDIFKWNTRPEPTEQELEYYRKKDIKALGAPRYNEIHDLMVEKKEAFHRILGSPAPELWQNAASIFTTLDDINDTLGTFAFIAKIVARKLPAVLAKSMTGPIGWALLGADLASLAMELSGLPYLTRRLQHSLNSALEGNPVSKKARLKRMNKLKRLGITKGHLIEALQVTENMFGVGISLGPIVGLATDIPFGLYRHVTGEKVTIYGLPQPLLWFDHKWSAMLKHAACLFTGLPVISDREANKAMAAVNLASQVSHSYLAQISPLDAIDIIKGLQVRAPTPQLPSTRQIVKDELGDPDSHTGWPHTGTLWADPTRFVDECCEWIQENVRNWRQRNCRDEEARVAADNQIAGGLNIMASLEGNESLELEYEPFTTAMLKLMNINYRFPEGATQDQVQCFRNQVEQYVSSYGDIDTGEARMIAKEQCGFEFTQQVPERPQPSAEELAEQKAHNIDSLRHWYFVKLQYALLDYVRYTREGNQPLIQGAAERIRQYRDWLNRYGYPEGQPETWYTYLSEDTVNFYKTILRTEPPIF